MKNKITAAVLAFFLGGIGIHRFYLGQTLYGCLYLFFCWTFIPSVLGFIDFICFVVMSDENFNAKYNKAHTPEYLVTKNTGSAADEIAKLHKLKREGIITDEEFEKKKKEFF